MLVDSHVNLHAEQFDADRDAVIERARAAGVVRMIGICARLSEAQIVAETAARYDDVFPTLGAHPHHAKDRPDVTADEIAALARDMGAVAIGECGLDFHYNYSPHDQQRASFAAHVAAARQLDLPLVIHCRDADDAMADLLEQLWTDGGPFRFLLHSYTGGAGLAQRGARLGGFFSVNGIASFKNAHDVRSVVTLMPEDRILIETDAPYLAPVPWRGRRNEPAYLPHVAEALAGIRGWSVAETAERTTNAFHALFDRVPRAEAGSEAATDAKTGAS